MGTHFSTHLLLLSSLAARFCYLVDYLTMQKLLCITILLLAIIVDANYIRGRHALGRKKREGSHLKTHPVDMEHCRDGRKRKCSCSDDSDADLTQRVCPPGANIDQSSCVCPDGFEEYEPEFRSHGLHKLCKGPEGLKRRSICKCSDGALADWTKHPCTGNAHLKSCTCWA